MQTLHIHELIKNCNINVYPQDFYLKTSFCDLFILHILTPGVIHTVIATMIIYVDHLLRHISRKSPIRKTSLLGFPREFPVMLTSNPVSRSDCYHMLARAVLLPSSLALGPSQDA